MPEPPTMPRTALVMKLPYARKRGALPAGRDRASNPPLSCSTLVLQLIHPSVPFQSSHHCAARSLANFGIKGTLAIYDSSALFGFEIPPPTRGYNDRNFKSTALE